MYARTNTARHLSGISSWIPDSRPQLPAPGPATHTRATLYLPGIDGLRAIAVIAVVLYHADLAWIPGGYLGVEVFFVISGYLITSLLLAEIQRRNGELDLKGFWIRRARRLLPALLLLIGVVVAYSLLFIPEEVAGLRADIIAALTYTTNWYFVFSEQSYFEAVGRQPLLQHLWSLAVEEQFYLFWPLLFIAGLRLLGRKFFLCAIVLSATASTVLMVLLYAPDQESSRLYFGTDTRAAGLLIGAALAFAWSPGRLPGHPILRTSAALDTLGLVALVVLAHQLMTLSEYEPFLYRGGILLTALTTAVIIAVAVHPAAHVGRLLGVRPLRWIGLRSYGIYLWHWPIFMVTRPQLDVPFDGLALFALRIGLTCAIAEFSYRLVETPIRNGALDQGLVALRAAQGQAGQRLALYRSALGTALATLTITLGIAVVNANLPAPPEFLTATWTPEVLADQGFTAAASSAVDLKPPAADPTPKASPSRSSPIFALGDSVMLGAADMLRSVLGPSIVVDAAVGRQVSSGVKILRAHKAAGQIGDLIIIHLGNNGIFTAKQFDEIMQIAGPSRSVVFLTVKVPRRWEALVNKTLRSSVPRYHNAMLIDWRKTVSTQPQALGKDGIHLQSKSLRMYAQLIKNHLLGR